MRKITKVLMVALVLTIMPLKHWAQTPYRQYANDGIELNFTEIQNVDFRAFLLYNLTFDNRFVLIPENENGVFNLSSSDDLSREDFFDAFESFYQSTYTDFHLLSKMEIAELSSEWKSKVNPRYFSSMMMDITQQNSRYIDGEYCVESIPFCTDFGYASYTASYMYTIADEDADYGCLSRQYNPKWFCFRIGYAGPFVIHIEGFDTYDSTLYRDVDFCLWGPYTGEPGEQNWYDVSPWACNNLTSDKIIDCSYNVGSEDVYIGYPEGEHVHGDMGHGMVNYHETQVGEFYILLITNYSNRPCYVRLYKTEGIGGTNCNPEGVYDNSVSKLNVYPNPAQDKINIESPNMKNVAVFNLLGVLIENKKVNDDYAVISTNEFSQGTYILKVEYLDGSVGYSRFVVAK